MPVTLCPSLASSLPYPHQGTIDNRVILLHNNTLEEKVGFRQQKKTSNVTAIVNQTDLIGFSQALLRNWPLLDLKQYQALLFVDRSPPCQNNCATSQKILEMNQAFSEWYRTISQVDSPSTYGEYVAACLSNCYFAALWIRNICIIQCRSTLLATLSTGSFLSCRQRC